MLKLRLTKGLTMAKRTITVKRFIDVCGGQDNAAQSIEVSQSTISEWSKIESARLVFDDGVLVDAYKRAGLGKFRGVK